jgi:chromosome segregation ATPase
MNEDPSEPHFTRYTSQPSKYDMPLLISKPSTDEYSKNKIGELQEEVGRLRREAAQRECIWNKEKNQLLNKAEIFNLENV